MNKFYFFWKHQFGQWTLRDMKDNEGIVYNCCEQYMMAQKARLFDDISAFEKIMTEKNPEKQKELGRGVRNYNQGIWEENREIIVYEGNTLKFTQHEDLGKRLIATHPAILVEASPYDLVWGVGLSAKDPLILDEKNWRGLNLLGKALMRVREDLIKNG